MCPPLELQRNKNVISNSLSHEVWGGGGVGSLNVKSPGKNPYLRMSLSLNKDHLLHCIFLLTK